jgi:hypothetical protein
MNRNILAQCLWHEVMMAMAWILLVGGAFLLPQSFLGQTPGKNFLTDAVQIEPVKSNEVSMSPEFHAAIYENLVAEVTKAGEFRHVYRSSDRRASNASNMLFLRTTVEGFKHGSEKVREVTTVAGWTLIKADVQLVTRDGHILLDRQVEGKVRLFGGNLKATHDLAKKVAKKILRTEVGYAMHGPGAQH